MATRVLTVQIYDTADEPCKGIPVEATLVDQHGDLTWDAVALDNQIIVGATQKTKTDDSGIASFNLIPTLFLERRSKYRIRWFLPTFYREEVIAMPNADSPLSHLIPELPLAPSDPTISQTIYMWAQATSGAPIEIPDEAVHTEGTALSLVLTADAYVVFAQLASLDDFTSVSIGGFGDVLPVYLKGASPFTFNLRSYEYWVSALEQGGSQTLMYRFRRD